MSRVRRLLVAGLIALLVVAAGLRCSRRHRRRPRRRRLARSSAPIGRADVAQSSVDADRRRRGAPTWRTSSSSLKAIHPNPFLDEGEAAFMARVASDRGSRRHA